MLYNIICYKLFYDIFWVIWSSDIDSDMCDITSHSIVKVQNQENKSENK